MAQGEGEASSGISRRRFIQAAGAVVLAAGCGGGVGKQPGAPTSGPTSTAFSPPTRRLSGELRILQWSHFVPRHDRWFDPFAKAWGTRVGVNVSVDHINQADLAARTSSEIAARAGHDLIELIWPPAALEPAVLDLSDLQQEAERRFGKQTPLCTRSTYNPTTKKYFGFCHGWVPDPGDYRKSMWQKVGLANGPATWQDLLEGGGRIRRDQGVHMGIGLSNEIDSNMAARALIWSFGGSIQDERERVVINSPQTIEAVEFMARLYKQTMSPEVFGWNAASNNQGLVAGQLSYILNSISAYRTAQQSNPDVADDIFFTPALKGPGGTGFACEHAIPIYVVPKHSKNPDAAKEFILHLVANYSEATRNSELYTFPAFPSTVPKLAEWLGADPYGSKPADKLAFLKDAERWSTNLGHPGPANAAVSEVFETFVIPTMMARVARGERTAKDAVVDAERQITAIFDKWRTRGLVGGR